MAGIKTAFFWLEKRCRRPKWQGTATATCSAANLNGFVRSAREKRGRLFVVDCRNADHGRRIIAAWRNGERPDIGLVPAITTVLHDGRVVALGQRAALAIAGGSFSIQTWDENIRRHGKVSIEDSKCLTGNEEKDLKKWHPQTVFGQKLGEPGE